MVPFVDSGIRRANWYVMRQGDVHCSQRWMALKAAIKPRTLLAPLEML